MVHYNFLPKRYFKGVIKPEPTGLRNKMISENKSA